MKFKQTSKKYLHVELIDTPKPVTGKLCIWFHWKIENFFDSISICAIFSS